MEVQTHHFGDQHSAIRPGRPRGFDADDALSEALKLFLTRGYMGASVTDLTAAMGIARPSLYRCFGNKESLFKHALALHAERHMSYLNDALGEPTVRSAIEQLLRVALSDRDPCSGVQGFIGLFSALPDGPDADEARAAITTHHAEAINALTERFERAQRDGQLSPEARPEALAYYLEALIHGIAVQGRNGAALTDLEDLVELVLSAIQDRATSSGVRTGQMLFHV